MSTTVLLVLLVVSDVIFLLALRLRRPKPDGTLVVTENGGAKKVTLELTTDPDALEKKDKVIFEVKQVRQTQ